VTGATVLLSLVGVGLNALVLRDMFQTIFAPSGSGMLSRWAARLIWRAVHAMGGRRERLTLAGPVAMVAIILLWTGGLVLGWACLVWPHLPEEFLLSSGMSPERNDGFLDALYVSLVTIGTLGYGEITPDATWLRLLAPVEALIGFSLFTAAISWIMSVHPALARRRHLSREVTLLQRGELRAGVTIMEVEPATQGAVLRNLASQVIAVRDDFVQFPVTYFFWTADEDAALDVALWRLASLAREAGEADDPGVRLSAALLLEALHDLAGHLGETLVETHGDTDLDAVLAAYAADHKRGPAQDR
jgi:hypothetical protein